MKYYRALILFFLLVPILCSAENLIWSFNPTSVSVNTMNTASFDPTNPFGQPDLTQLTITNTSNSPIDSLQLKVEVYWNTNPLVEAKFRTKEGVALLPSHQFHLGNRDLITNFDNVYFELQPGETGISVESVVNANSTLKSAVYAGYFPDGDLILKVSLKEKNSNLWQYSGQVFIMKIRNAGVINLLSPGVAIGQNPPEVSDSPLSFLWNSLSTGFNFEAITIREFPPSNPPNTNTVANTGSLFYQNESCYSGFSDYLPFNPGNYYAWQVSTSLATEYTVSATNSSNPKALKSNWFVFRYANEATGGSSIAEFQARLNNLNNNSLRNIQVEGYIPVGVIIFDGKTYTGKEALDLIDTLIGQDIEVLLKD